MDVLNQRFNPNGGRVFYPVVVCASTAFDRDVGPEQPLGPLARRVGRVHASAHPEYTNIRT